MKLANPMKPKNSPASTRRFASAFEGRGQIWPNASPGGERVGTAVYHGQHVFRFVNLQVAVPTRAEQLEPGGSQQRRQATDQPGIVELHGLQRLDAIL